MKLSTPFTTTLGQIVSVVVAVAVVLWTVLTFTIGSIRDDVKAIRESVISVQGADRTALTRSHDIEIKLVEQVGGLRADLASFGSRIETVVARLDTATSSLNVVATRFDKLQGDIVAWQTSYSDPKRYIALYEHLKKAGFDEQKIIIVPLPVAPIPDRH